LLRAGLRAGIVLGAVAGTAAAVRTLLAQRYLDTGLHHLALEAIAQATTAGVGIGALSGIALASALSVGAAVLARLPGRLRPQDEAGGAVLVLALQAAVVAALAALRDFPAWPSIHRPAGLAAAAALSLLGVGVALVLGGASPLARRVAASAARLAGARPAWIAALAGVALLQGASALCAARAPEGAPNLVFITIDTLRPDHLGAWGYVRDTSPEMDRLARDGVRFAQAVAQWPKTTPSFVSMHTSTYPRTNGVTRDTQQALPAPLPTIAERLADAGYETAAVVTNANLARLFGFDQGFASYVETWKDERPDDPERGGYVTDHALAWLARRPKDRAFFLWVHYVDPHARYEPPAPYDGMFVGDAHYDPTRRAPLHAGRDEDMGGIPARSRLGDRDEVDFYVAQYDAEIRYTDFEIGRLLAALDETSPRERTVVVLTADHGEALGEHGYYFDHGRLPYDDCARVPLLVRAPGAVAGRVVERPVELIDVLPTLLALAGLPPSPGAEGRSLFPLLSGDDDPGRAPYAFTESGYTEAWQRALRDERWKLVHVRDPADRALMTGAEWELYDVLADPGETRNRIADAPAEAARLTGGLDEWVRRGPSGPTAATQTVPIDRETEERLRNLGYVE
jgi:arylsulfatase A-like enzyme